MENNLQSEVMVHYKDQYAGTIDLLCGVPKISTDLQFDEDKHEYLLNGKSLPSVTKLLDTGEYNNVDPDVLNRARERGTEIHKELEEYFKNGKYGDTKEFYEAISLLKQDRYKYLLEEPTIIDFKTYAEANTKNKKKCLRQEKLYGKAVYELTKIKIKNYVMIHLPKSKNGCIIVLERVD